MDGGKQRFLTPKYGYVIMAVSNSFWKEIHCYMKEKMGGRKGGREGERKKIRANGRKWKEMNQWLKHKGSPLIPQFLSLTHLCHIWIIFFVPSTRWYRLWHISSASRSSPVSHYFRIVLLSGQRHDCVHCLFLCIGNLQKFLCVIQNWNLRSTKLWMRDRDLCKQTAI